MIYLIYGTQKKLIDDRIKELCNIKKDAEITRIDASEEKKFRMNSLLDACLSKSLFAENNIVLVRNPYFLSKKADDQEIEQLNSYLSNPLYETDLIFYSYDLINERLKLVKDIMNNARVFVYKDLKHKDFMNYAEEIYKNSTLKLTRQDKDYLFNAVNDDLDVLCASIEILELYPDNIDSSIIKKLIAVSANDDVYNLINAICKKEINKAYKYFGDMLNSGNNIFGLISLMANQLHYLYNVSYYLSLGHNDDEIMSLTQTKSPYRLKMAKESLRNFTKKEIIKLLSSLSDLDYKMKSDNSIDQKQYFELFICTLKEA